MWRAARQIARVVVVSAVVSVVATVVLQRLGVPALVTALII
jgi:hypothetical protein